MSSPVLAISAVICCAGVQECSVVLMWDSEALRQDNQAQRHLAFISAVHTKRTFERKVLCNEARLLLIILILALKLLA
ncbi:hypothetical protein AV530_003881 [Patagioenas fasciata monilis]|uniref:Uncharacterized protein n=1 Tax=Patagioenas fasciata monilis TaxID=372326 RepID=A0A1V4KZX6_PATFA|nr:hypothetical protein AV530_003881 [Patagioenas fasciata monilis]